MKTEIQEWGSGAVKVTCCSLCSLSVFPALFITRNSPKKSGFLSNLQTLSHSYYFSAGVSVATSCLPLDFIPLCAVCNHVSLRGQQQRRANCTFSHILLSHTNAHEYREWQREKSLIIVQRFWCQIKLLLHIWHICPHMVTVSPKFYCQIRLTYSGFVCFLFACCFCLISPAAGPALSSL